MSEKKLTHFEVKKSAFPAELNENEKKVRDELLAAAVSLNDLAAAGPSKKTMSRRSRVKAFKKRQQNKVIASKVNETKNVKERKREILKKPTDSRHAIIEKHWNEKIRMLQPIKGPLPLFINECTEDLEVIRMKQDVSSANALKCKFGKSAIPTSSVENDSDSETIQLLAGILDDKEEEQIQQQQVAQDDVEMEPIMEDEESDISNSESEEIAMQSLQGF